MYNEGIAKGLEDKMRNEVISRKIYLSFPTEVFKGLEEVEFKVQNSIANFFKVPLYSIQVVGSGKTGYSYYKNTSFELGKSDLDIAVIDPNLFRYYAELVFKHSNGFKDLSKFGRNKNGVPHHKIYKNSLLKGMFRPDAMPAIKERSAWFKFFNKLSADYIDLFKDINCGIYFSQLFFEMKQSDNIEWYKNTKVNDKV